MGNRFYDLDSLNITSVALLGCPFMPKQGQRSLKKVRTNQKRNTNGGARGCARPPVRVTFLIFSFLYNEKRSLKKRKIKNVTRTGGRADVRAPPPFVLRF